MPAARLLACALALGAAAAGAPEEPPKPMPKTNRLAAEKSPYLLQHAGNPVDWRPWGEEAFASARAEGKPIFLSIGYSTCHWCHVMERESFADPRTAEVMNRLFVNIKVDREERPDVDKVYMSAAAAVGWGGGWPLSMWLTPDLKPFYGGTYFPPEGRWGRPGFAEICARLGALWAEKREAVAADADKLVAALKGATAVEGREGRPEPGLLEGAYRAFKADFDPDKGGFAGAPKFPMPVNQNLLLRYYARSGDKDALELVRRTLAEMAKGGIYDHVGGGFHRYSTDDQWRVPHFEKMLYDNAQLAVNFLEAYQATRDETLAKVARETLDYALRDMTHPEGGFYSAEDADSLPPGAPPGAHKAEGAYYLWTEPELVNALGPEVAPLFIFRYGVKSSGNAYQDPQGEFEGKNILYAEHSLEETAKQFKKGVREVERVLDRARKSLRELRAQRPRPHLDDKILTGWNGLMLSALAKGGAVLDEPAYLGAAAKAARFLRARVYDAKARRLYHRWRDGERAVEGQASDYAFLAQGLLDLYEASFDPDHLDWALESTETLLKRFADPKGGFFMTPEGGSKELLTRVLEDSDNVEPGASSVAALNLLRLAQFTDRKDLRQAAERTLERFGAQMARHPRSLPQMLAAVDFALSKPRQIIIAGGLEEPGTREMLRRVHARFIPGRILMVVPEGPARERLVKRLPILQGMRAIKGRPTAYICLNYACELPTSDLQAVESILDGKKGR